MLSLNDVQIPPPKSWEKLEALLWELLRAEWNDFHAQRNGRRGQAQQGVDVFGKPASGRGWTGVQCKNKDLLLRATLTVKELRQEVHKAKSFRPPLKKFIIATTAPRDARIQEEARKLTDQHRKAGLFSVHVYAWDDVQDLMAKHDAIAKQYYGNFWPTGDAVAPILSGAALQAAFTAPPFPPTSGSTQEIPVQVLSAPAAQALGLLATSPLPFPRESYEKVFPHTDWAIVLSELIGAKAVAQADAVIVVSDTVKTQFLPTDAARNVYLDAWIAALEPLADHVDMALFLALQYVARGEPIRAVEIIAPLAEGLERGIWNNQYAVILGAFDKPAFLRRLTPDQRRRYLSAYGICLARANKPAEARACAGRLLAASKRAGNRESEAQALLLFGLAHQYLGETDHAATYYERAAAYAKKHGVKLLVGHALHNLAMLKAEADPGEAGRLLEFSIAAKTRAKDEPGRMGAMFGRGSLAATEGQFDLALKWYSRAERLAAKWDMQHTRALALCNMGTAQGDVGNPRAALPHYQAAEELAAREGFPDALALAVGGAAKAYLALNRFAKAEERFRRLHEIHREAGDAAAAVVALHDVGVCLLNQDKYGEARAVLTSAYVEAVDQRLSDWIYRCAKDIALTRLTSDGVDQAVSALRKAAAREAAEGRHEVSAGLWESVASVLAEHAPERLQIEQSLLNALAETDLSDRPPEERFRLLSGLYQHRWDAGDVKAALETLRTGFQLAKEQNNAEYCCRFADQLGMCLQRLGDSRVAIPHHRAALRVARSLQQSELVENCLNNLGEALRNTGNAAEAIQLFLEAEAVARGRGDAESEISVAHNRALAMQDAGQRAQAAAVLRHCRDVSLRLECWDQFVRALHGLANHAWMGSKTEAALGLYRQALAAAKKNHLSDQAVLISVNYANALLTRHRPRQAYTILLAVRGSDPAGPDALHYEFALGATAEEVGDFPTAAAAFETALTVARAAGDAERVVQAATSLAECHMKAGHPDRAGQVLDAALAAENTARHKTPLLTARLRLLLATGQRSQAGRVFGQVTRLARANGMKEELVDLHMMLGDYDWEHGKSKDRALTAYSAGLVPAGEVGMEVMIKTGAHAVRRLLDLPAADRVDQIEALLARQRTWLKGKVSTGELANAERIILWPLRVALRVSRDCLSLPGVSDRLLTRFVTEELFGSA